MNLQVPTHLRFLRSLQNQKRIKRGLSGALVLLGFGVASLLTGAHSILETATLDFRYRHFNHHRKASSEVVVLDIDEQSLKLLESSYGRFPWPRKIYKEMLEFLGAGEPAGILFDIYFSERMLGTDDDSLLAQATQSLPQVSHAANLLDLPAEDRKSAQPLPEGFSEKFGLKWFDQEGPTFAKDQNTMDYLLPNPVILAATHRVHVGRFQKDSDGVFRQSPLLFRYQQTWLPSLTAAGLLSKVKTPQLRESSGRLEIFEGSGKGTSPTQKPVYTIQVDSRGLTPIHYYRPTHGPETISFASALSSAVALQRGQVEDPSKLNVNPLDLKDKIILIGSSAAGLQDLKATPVDPLFPGVKLAATVISNVLQGKTLSRLSSAWTLVVCAFLVFFTYGSVFFLTQTTLKILPPLLFFASWVGLSLVTFEHWELQLPLALPGILLLTTLVDGLAYSLFVENTEKKRLSSTLSKYLSPSVSQQLIEEGINPQAEVGHTQELSILFSDIRGFTSFSETLAPEILVARLNEYLAKMTDIVFEMQGTLDKFIGDAVMAFWGAPLPTQDHALRSVKAALLMQSKVEQIKAEWKNSGQPTFDLKIGIGINTGPVIVGNIGSERRLDYTVIGDNVNLASRIEGTTKLYGVTLLIGETTYEQVRGQVLCRTVDAVTVKGKVRPVVLYEPLALIGEQTHEQERLASHTQEAWAAYQAGDFSECLKRYEEIRQLFPTDPVATLYIERIKIIQKNPPKNWDGIFSINTK